MSQVLRLFITAEWPTQRAACEWALVSASGAQLQRGCSEPRHWPQAESCELILGAEQCLLLHARLPKGSRARTPEVVAYSLEDQLIGETDAELFVIGEDTAANTNANDGTGNSMPGATTTPVWVIARARLRALLAALQPLGRRPVRIVSEIQLAPLQAGWSVCLRTDMDVASGTNGTNGANSLPHGFARLAAEDGFSFDLENLASPPIELQLALQAARKAGSVPPSIEVYATQGMAFDAETASAWQSALGLPVHLAGEYAWRNCSIKDARNLLVGEFSPPRKPQDGWGNLRPALIIGFATLFIYAGFSFGEWAWLDHQRKNLQQEMTSTFRATFPQVQAVVDPPLQMQRLHDQLRRERGQLGATDFLPLLAAASEITGGQGKLRSIGFEDGRLELTLIMKSPAAAELLLQTMNHRGLTVTLRETRPTAGGVEAVFALRGTP